VDTSAATAAKHTADTATGAADANRATVAANADAATAAKHTAHSATDAPDDNAATIADTDANTHLESRTHSPHIHLN